MKSKVEDAIEATAEAVVEQAVADAVQRIYIGPNVAVAGLSQFATFIGELPAHIQDAIKELPELAALIVPVDGFGKIHTRLQDRTSSEFAFYRRVQEHFAQKRGGN